MYAIRSYYGEPVGSQNRRVSQRLMPKVCIDLSMHQRQRIRALPRHLDNKKRNGNEMKHTADENEHVPDAVPTWVALAEGIKQETNRISAPARKQPNEPVFSQVLEQRSDRHERA